MIVISLGSRVLVAVVVSFGLSFLTFQSPDSWTEAYFDALLRWGDPVPVSPEVVVVPGASGSSGDRAATAAPTDVLLALVELRAERVLLPAAWASAESAGEGLSGTVRDLSALLDEEFLRIDENVAALFEAIRIGSIDPAEAERFVAELRRLVGESNTRIQGTLRGSDGGGPLTVARLVESLGSDRLGRTVSDLGLAAPHHPSAVAIPLPPPEIDGGPEFNRIPYTSLERYVGLVDWLSGQLAGLEEEGYFDEVDPLRLPRIMRDYVDAVQAEFLEEPTELRGEAWRDAMSEYLETMAQLISVDAEARLIDRLTTLEGDAELDPESEAHLQEVRAELSSTFGALREEHAALVALRAELADALAGSVVILEDEIDGGDGRAVAVNSALVGAYAYAPIGRDRILLLVAAGLLAGLILAPFRFSAVVVLAPLVILLVIALFPVIFLLSDIRVDPVSAVTVVVGAVAAAIIAAGVWQGWVERSLTGRGAVRLPRRVLRRALRRGALPGSELGRRRAAVIVVNLDERAGRGPKAVRFAHREIARRVRRLGGTILGEEGTTVATAFTAPPGSDDAILAHGACTAAERLAAATLPGGYGLRCGVEIGNLLFYLSSIGGYRATGRAVVYARRFCDLTGKHHRRIVIGETAVAACRDQRDSAAFEEVGKLIVSAEGGQYRYFGLRETGPPSP